MRQGIEAGKSNSQGKEKAILREKRKQSSGKKKRLFSQDGESRFLQDGRSRFSQDGESRFLQDGRSRFLQDGGSRFSQDSRSRYSQDGGSGFSQDGRSRERKYMSNMENSRINDEQLKEVSGGLYGGGAGQWSPAMVKAAGGLYSYTRSGSTFVKSSQFVIPYGEYITVDIGRRSGNYIVAFYNDQEAWVDTAGLQMI